ncbi:MAG: diguanylate cyclase [Gammaproteobacteria bacterium]|nr:diguanylate cyclase [Gammaproteobacteria bacterium]
MNETQPQVARHVPDGNPSLYLGLGFLLITLLMASLALLGWLRTETLHEQMEQLNQEQALKLDRIHRMRSIVRERFIRMSLVTSVADPFLQDDYAREFDRLAGAFVQARAEVERLATDPAEAAMLRELRAMTATGTVLMVAVVEKALAGHRQAALTMLLDEALPMQERVMRQTDAILQAFVIANEAALADLGRTHARTRQLILLIAASAILLTLLIAFYITRRIQHDRQALLEEIDARIRVETLQERLWHLAHHDPLSGLPNRSLFQDHLRQALERARRSGRLAALMLCDLNDFKQINDRHGHGAGDAVIVATAGRLCAAVRGSDLVARLAGDEFTVLLEDLDREQDALDIARKILARVSEPIRVDGAELRVGISIGIALFPAHGGDGESLLRQADAAMYAAKQDHAGDIRIAPSATPSNLN